MKLDKVYPRMLQKEIKYIYILQSEGNVNVPMHRHLPDGTFDLIINLGVPIYQYDNKGEKIARPDILFVGGFNRYFHASYSGGVHLIGVIFQFGYGSQVINDRLDRNLETLIPADLIFGQDIHVLAEQLAETHDHDSIRLLVEKFFKNKISCNSQYYAPRISKSVDLLLRHKGNIRSREIRDKVNMSERNFRRIFAEHTGFSPKELSRIIRVKNLVHFLKNGCTIQEAVYQLGYYDTSHVIHDFKSIAGLTPKAYMNQMNIIDENFVKASEYAKGLR